MNEHLGTVLLAFNDGRMLDAVATLSKDDSGTWGGTLSFPANARTAELLNLVDGAVQIDGRVGKFVRPDTSDWLDSPEGELQILIQGNGDAPF